METGKYKGEKITSEGENEEDIFHIAAVGHWVEWRKQMLRVHVHLGMQFNSHGELDGESSQFHCENSF